MQSAEFVSEIKSASVTASPTLNAKQKALYISMRKCNASVFVLGAPQQSHCADPACSLAPVKRSAVQGEPHQTKVAT